MARVAVIGAGLGGMAAAIRLAAAGRTVRVYDQRDSVGGKAGERHLSGSGGTWRFDTGPSLLTLPGVLDDLFAAANRRREDYLEILPLDPITRYWFSDGSRVRSSPDAGKLGRRFDEAGICGEDDIRSYLDYSRRIWDITHEVFLERSLHEPADMIRNPRLWRSLARLGRIDAFRSMDAAHRRFFSDPRACQFFDRYATYNGSDPYRVPATLNIIPHVEYGLGGYAVKGGIAAIPRSLETLARELGVEFRLGQAVRSILTDAKSGPGRVRGVRTETEEWPAETVICNADVSTAYAGLLDDSGAPLARRYRRLAPSSSGLVFFWAMKSDYPELGVHNIFFSGDYPTEFRSIFSEDRCPEDPTVYVNITSKVDRSDAPAPGENWFILVNAPPDGGQDWNDEIYRVRNAVLRRIEGALGRSIAEDIAAESTLTPPDIAAETASHRGSLYGISSNSRMAAFLRHPNRSRRYPGLYFCGGSAHPGGGMPLVMLSGRIAADLALRHGGER